MGLLRFLLIILAGYLLFRVIGRLLLPWLGKKAVNKAREQMEEQMKRQQSGERIYKDGETEIRSKKNTPSRPKSDDQGEYVDYVEVD